MDSAISDLALDLGVFALDDKIENGRTRVTHSAAPTNSACEEQTEPVCVEPRSTFLEYRTGPPPPESRSEQRRRRNHQATRSGF